MPTINRPKTSSLVAAAAIFSACATPRSQPYDQMRVVILDVHTDCSRSMAKNGQDPACVINERGVRTVMENELLKNNLTVVDEAELSSIRARMDQSKESGIHTTATSLREYQPAATHGIILDTRENIGLLSVLTLGVLPYAIETTARLIDLRTGEVRASPEATSHGLLLWWSPAGTYRGVRAIAGQIADTLQKIQEYGRHLRPKDWPTNAQTDSSDPSAQGRFTHAVYLAMDGSSDEALDELEAAVSLDRSYAVKARQAWELKPLRDDPRFMKIVRQALGAKNNSVAMRAEEAWSK